MPDHIVSELQDLTAPVGLTLDLGVEDGGCVLGDTPGLGIRVDEAAIARDWRPRPVIGNRTVRWPARVAGKRRSANPPATP